MPTTSRRKSSYDEGARAERAQERGSQSSNKDHVAGVPPQSTHFDFNQSPAHGVHSAPPVGEGQDSDGHNSQQRQAWASPSQFSGTTTMNNMGNSVNIPPEIREMNPEQVEHEIDAVRKEVWKRATGLAVGLILVGVSFWAAYIWAVGLIFYLVVMVGVAWKHFKTQERLVFSTCCCTPINAINYFYMALFPLIFLSGISVVTSLVAASEHEGDLDRIFAVVCVLASFAVGVTSIALVPITRRLNQMCWHRYGPQMGSDMQPRVVAVGGGDRNPHQTMAVAAAGTASLHNSANPPPNQPVIIQQGLPAGGLGGGGSGQSQQQYPLGRASSFERKPGTGFQSRHAPPPGAAGHVHSQHQQGSHCSHPQFYHQQAGGGHGGGGYQHQQVYPVAQPAVGNIRDGGGENLHFGLTPPRGSDVNPRPTESNDIEIEFRQPTVSPTSSPAQRNLLQEN